ncbi:DENN domain-containing protein 1B isoform X3 [Histomonas meleagridis]|uniref:DENN domain-containing protein 1B isoform X3 n=1 Tax=Histomonas meleagridis TaxID=135588 RepID=UPI0035597922|nr:DENN domain-containing protein 1B isoform X3 [Histomonas meleagridis]KAH0798751.1 DENN domain-containing protein 1B isoform X3 [Histomonas meleagridis]
MIRLGAANSLLFNSLIAIEKEGNKTHQTVIFPESPTQDIPSLAKLCFPVKHYSKYKHSSNGFTIYVTDSNKESTYGYVIIQPKIRSKKIAYCILSSFYDPQKLFNVLEFFLQCKDIRDGIDLLKRFQRPQFSQRNIAVLEHSVILSLLSDTFSTFDPVTIFKIIFSLVLDKHIIITSTDVSRITQYAFAFLALIHPIQWPGVFIPILSKSFEDTLYAPFPFIVGAHSSTLKNIYLQGMDDHIIINLDKPNIVENPPLTFPDNLLTLLLAFADNTKWDENQLASICRKLVIDIVALGLGISSDDSPKAFLSTWDKLRVNAKGTDLIDMICQSQVVMSLMRSIEEADGAVYNSYWKERTKKEEISSNTSNVATQTKNLTSETTSVGVQAKIKSKKCNRNSGSHDKNSIKKKESQTHNETKTSNADNNKAQIESKTLDIDNNKTQIESKTLNTDNNKTQIESKTLNTDNNKAQIESKNTETKQLNAINNKPQTETKPLNTFNKLQTETKTLNTDNNNNKSQIDNNKNIKPEIRSNVNQTKVPNIGTRTSNIGNKIAIFEKGESNAPNNMTKSTNANANVTNNNTKVVNINNNATNDNNANANALRPVQVVRKETEVSQICKRTAPHRKTSDVTLRQYEPPARIKNPEKLSFVDKISIYGTPLRSLRR